MDAKSVFFLLLAMSVSLPVVAQDKQPPQVDWEAKAIAIELGRLGDPEINMFLPELYEALRQSKLAAQADDRPVSTKGKAAVRPNMLSLLSNPSVRREIEMIDDQYDEVLERSQAIQSELTEYIGSLVLSSGTLDQEELRRKISEVREAARQEIEKSVLPFQLKRLEQLAYHVQMQRQGVVGVLVNDPLASQLGITDEQKERLQERAKKIDEELAREIAKLRVKARDKLFAELKSGQREKLTTIIGDAFEFEEVNWRKSATAKKAGPNKPKSMESKEE